ncbi:MAG: VacB/RNase II family 3'-5' exoribonuclease [Aestuariivita sp.]|nr:VacB/RNase II family 3'-5' exoribonuclease [Aestuariivita sp.]MCY4347187.1 VacB/RNase II family 3'-5' exoribonuclease [Aestuariivita sp.]
MKRNQTRSRKYTAPVSVLAISERDKSGNLIAHPWRENGKSRGSAVRINPKSFRQELKPGDRVLARLHSVTGKAYSHDAKVIRRLKAANSIVTGVFEQSSRGAKLRLISKSRQSTAEIPKSATMGASDGELVEGEYIKTAKPRGRRKVRVTKRTGIHVEPKSRSRVAIHQHDIPFQFSQPVIAVAETLPTFSEAGRESLCDLPFITIDPSDARDHDDAVFACKDDEPTNIGGWIIWVAIADVSAYVTPGTLLDAEARNRGNSTYFVDKVVPMLPETLSEDLCSIRAGVVRPCIAVKMQIDSTGEKISHQFVRGYLRSHGAFNYEEVQDAIDGHPNDRTQPILETILKPLFGAYSSQCQARERRQPLDLEVSELAVELSTKGYVTAIRPRTRLVAHRMIEDFMILANVSAAETLTAERVPMLYRVHEPPTQYDIDICLEALRTTSFDLLDQQTFTTRSLNEVLHTAKKAGLSEMVNLFVLRAMTQAKYSTKNCGHFGLALQCYTHFTSPIRRYSDLLVHRGLITAHRWDGNGLSELDIDSMTQTAAHVSATERRSWLAERDTRDRYLASYFSQRVGEEFIGQITASVRAGLFVRLPASGASGFIPRRAIAVSKFNSRQDGFGWGKHVRVRLQAADEFAGSLEFRLLSILED